MTAAEVYAVLVEECGADPEQRESYGFDRYWDEPGWKEYRFVGALGFGGKVHRSERGQRMYVSCYPEHRTPERDAMIERANARLTPGPKVDE